MADAYTPKHGKIRHTGRNIALTLMLLLLGMLAWLLIEPHTLHIERVTVESGSLEKNVGQLRIVYVSDIHQSSWPFFTSSDAASLVKTINAQNADLILLGGDYATDPASAIDFFRDLPRLRSSHGCYAVLGECDRDLSGSRLQQLCSMMASKGVTPVINTVERVRVGTQNICIAGLDDALAGWPDTAGVAAQCKQEDFVILMAHNPSLAADAMNAQDMNGQKTWFDLSLFGHTHGMSTSLLGNLIGLPQAYGDFQYGWYFPNRSSMLVSGGVGTTVLPLRFGRKPQIHVITVRSTAR